MWTGALSILLGMVGCGHGPQAVRAPQHLAIVYTNNVQGEIEPCG